MTLSMGYRTQSFQLTAAQQAALPARPFAVTAAKPITTTSLALRCKAASVGTNGGADTLEQRRQEAREWIAAWRSNGASSPAPSQENGTAVQAEHTAPPTPQAAESASQNGAGGKYSPDETYEDGTVLYNSSSLLAVDFEDILSP